MDARSRVAEEKQRPQQSLFALVTQEAKGESGKLTYCGYVEPGHVIVNSVSDSAHTIQLMDATTGSLKQKRFLGVACHDVTTLSDGKILMSYGDSPTELIDPVSLNTIATLRMSHRLDTATEFGNYWVATENRERPTSVYVYDRSQDGVKLVAQLRLEPRTSSIQSLCKVSDTTFVVGQSQQIVVIQVRGNQLDKIAEVTPAPTPALFAVTSNPFITPLDDGRWLSIENRLFGRVKYWSSDHRCQQQFDHGISLQRSHKIQRIPGTHTLMTLGAKKSEICLWDLSTSKPYLLTLRNDVKVNDFCVLPNGNIMIASNTGLHTLRLNHVLRAKLKPDLIAAIAAIYLPEIADIISTYFDIDVRLSPDMLSRYDSISPNLFANKKPKQFNLPLEQKTSDEARRDPSARSLIKK